MLPKPIPHLLPPLLSTPSPNRPTAQPYPPQTPTNALLHTAGPSNHQFPSSPPSTQSPTPSVPRIRHPHVRRSTQKAASTQAGIAALVTGRTPQHAVQ
ncbi:uncharacterized protein K441DRAFT_651546 [Cenococcum geophilum 1.58]|uniref:uncharacterized protein n=1 Tax=Cenococcum geophilum 1.58 TaxID=794803 RepID=UPI00358FFCA5|nr:hypothetical protein K441DRAFT_651546 [Cenococcum geophilum 1.58]